MKNGSGKIYAISIISIVLYKLYEIVGLEESLSATSGGYVISFFVLGVFAMVPTMILIGLFFDLISHSKNERKEIIIKILSHFKRWFRWLARLC